MPGNSQECLDHAQQCMRLAAEARRPSDKQHFEELSQRWIAQARDLEVTQGFSRHLGRSRPETVAHSLLLAEGGIDPCEGTD